MTTRSISRSVLLISALGAALGAGCSQGPGAGPGTPGTPAPGAATLVLVGGDVRTIDPERPAATAVAIAGDRIALVGGDAEVRRLAGPGARVIELGGKTVTPGLIDAHCHLYGLGADLEMVSVRGLPSEAATVAAVTAAAAGRPAGEWLVGRGWDQNRWPGQAFPTRAALDAAVGDRPVLLRRIDGHAVWVNSQALAAAKVTAATPDPKGGKIVRGPGGEPTGVLIDNAADLVDAVVPAPPAEVRERRIRAAARRAIEVGLTGVHDMGIDDATAAVYRQLAARGELPLRVYGLLSGDPANIERLRRGPDPATDRFELRAVKFFADGALGSRGARLYTDYTDDRGNRGLWVTEPERLAFAVEVATSAGWQVAVHAIGDAAIGSVIDAITAAHKKYPGEHRPRIEHLQILAPDDVPRLVETRAIASMQPTHATSDMPWAEQRLGPERIKGAYAWRTVLDKGIPLAAGSDFPVEEVSPLLGIYAAVTRQDGSGTPPGGWYPRQRMTLDEAITAFTYGAAYAGFAEGSRGRIAVGRLADLTVLDGAIAADRSLLERKAALTIVGGQIVHEARPGSGAR
ncbi:MAG TPA: amidohydrolase [Kofleriaceae bacterium]|nr:amidohydrolase [Kofleriaceae bacterium]